MRKLIILIFLLCITQSYAQKNEAVSEEEDTQVSDDDNMLNIPNKADVDLIIKILGNIGDYHQVDSDTDIQKKQREKKLKKYLSDLNQLWKGKKITFQSVKLEDVEADKELSSEGIKKAIKLIQKLKQQPDGEWIAGDGNLEDNPLLALTIGFQLAMCNACWRETGRFNGKFYLGHANSEYESNITLEKEEDEQKESESTKVKITRIFLKESSVINLKKGELSSVTGIIKSIIYKAESYSKELTINLE
jgi:hypothetical protein